MDIKLFLQNHSILSACARWIENSLQRTKISFTDYVHGKKREHSIKPKKNADLKFTHMGFGSLNEHYIRQIQYAFIKLNEIPENEYKLIKYLGSTHSKKKYFINSFQLHTNVKHYALNLNQLECVFKCVIAQC